MREARLIALSALLAAALVGGALFASRRSPETKPEAIPAHRVSAALARLKQKPTPGIEDSEHSHATFLLFLEDEPFDFARPRYMLRDKLAHFENGEGLTVHKHATGITVPYFLMTLGIELNGACLAFDTGSRSCSDASKKIRLLVNGEEVTDPDFYEIRDGDRILLNYGADTPTRLKLKMNMVQPVISPFKKAF